MFSKIFKIAVVALGLGMVGAVQAIPTLQLDIAGGTYDIDTQTIIAPSSVFSLYALLTPNPKQENLLTGTYYLSMAVAPQTGPATSNLGSFTFNGNTIDVTGDMVYGVPPVETNLTQDPGDLPKHSIFPTYFYEYAFNFNKNNKIANYNTQDRAQNGGLIPTSGTGTYFQTFQINTSALDPSVTIHFDLYNEVRRSGDIDVGINAPFSHDAQSSSTPVPEPATMGLLGMGLAGLGALRRRKQTT